VTGGRQWPVERDGGQIPKAKSPNAKEKAKAQPSLRRFLLFPADVIRFIFNAKPVKSAKGKRKVAADRAAVVWS
jgi:hypothetical protein